MKYLLLILNLAIHPLNQTHANCALYAHTLNKVCSYEDSVNSNLPLKKAGEIINIRKQPSLNVGTKQIWRFDNSLDDDKEKVELVFSADSTITIYHSDCIKKYLTNIGGLSFLSYQNPNSMLVSKSLFQDGLYANDREMQAIALTIITHEAG